MEELVDILNNQAASRYRCETYASLQATPSRDIARVLKDRIARQMAQKILEEDAYFTTRYDDYPVGAYVTIIGDVVVIPTSDFRKVILDARAEGVKEGRKGRPCW